MARRGVSCEFRLRDTKLAQKATLKALKAAAAALVGPPDRQDPGEALKLVRRAIKRLK